MKSGIELIAEERTRQVEVEGWTADYDQNIHSNGELLAAGVCYALGGKEIEFRHVTLNLSVRAVTELWPWDKKWWKPTPKDRVRELVKAGALIAAEIDRLQNLNK